MKKCGKCQIEKEVSDFYFYKNKPRHWCKRCDLVNTLIHQRIFKEKCVEYKGGECELCGYANSFAAMDFHHVDQSVKEFSIARSGRRKFDDRVKKELDKCQLLCANCHREAHAKEDYDSLKELWSWYEERRGKERLDKPIKKLCACGNVKSLRAATCLYCKNKNFSKRDINEVLDKLKEFNFNWTKTGKYYNISDNGIRKFVKLRGYDPQTIKEVLTNKTS